MTGPRFRRQVRLVVAALALLLAAAIVAKATNHDEVYTTIRELSPLVIAVLAAFLASRFQARAAFQASVRELWSDLVEAKNELFAYTTNPSPSHEQYAQAYKQLSKAIDEVRGVFTRNVGEDAGASGWYPYEPLHDMRRTLEALGPSPSEQERKKATDKIDQAWRALRPAVLAELEPTEPTRPIVLAGAVDERRPGRAPDNGWWRLLTRHARD
jgi:hypothetical protein